MSSGEYSADMEQTKQLLENIKIAFLESLPEKCSEQEILVLALNGIEEPEFTDIYDELYRGVHSLKGSAGTYGIPVISTVCHHLEDYIEGLNGQVSNVDDDFITQCLGYLDLIRKAAKEATTDNPDFSFVTDKLASLLNQASAVLKPVLVIESSSAVAMLYKDTLSKFPLDITIVNDGIEALQLLLHKHFYFIITGKALKSLNGSAVISALRASESANSKIKTVMISSATNIKFCLGSKPDFLIKRDEDMLEKLIKVVSTIIKKN